MGGRGSSSGVSVGGGLSKARELETEARELEREYYKEMSSVETRHSVGWRENTLKKIEELREQAEEIREKIRNKKRI